MNKHTVTRSNRSAVLDLVRAEYAKGRGATKRAARILGMEPDAVRAFAKRNGISLPDRSSHIAIVAEEYAKGWGARCRAARRLGISVNAVQHIATDNGISHAGTAAKTDKRGSGADNHV